MATRRKVDSQLSGALAEVEAAAFFVRHCAEMLDHFGRCKGRVTDDTRAKVDKSCERALDAIRVARKSVRRCRGGLFG
jgi:hypothetical protein